MGVGAEHDHAPPPGLAHSSKGFDLDDLGAAKLEDLVLLERHLLGGGGRGLLVSAAPEWGFILAGLGKLLWGRSLRLRSLCWPGVALGRGEGGTKAGLGSRLGQAGARWGHWWSGSGLCPLGKAITGLPMVEVRGGFGDRLGGLELGSAGVGLADGAGVSLPRAGAHLSGAAGGSKDGPTLSG